ncbi:sperm surface protein Sp17 isoform X1 [Balearica regulorum gibbericeps]|uniref:sperm surface protein Sp17 isoform X1 n=1 Tax=Balearica regulorum gibbericeps TaxID=100784 RepID=UPI003F5EAD6E
MSTSFSNTALRLPAGFQNLLEGLALEVLRAQPPDVVAFAAQHFQTLLEQREALPRAPIPRASGLPLVPVTCGIKPPPSPDASADPAAWGARLADEVLTQPPCQEPEEDEEKEDEDKEEEKAGEQAGSVASTATVRDPAPAPKTGLFGPKTAAGVAGSAPQHRRTTIPPQKSSR